MKKTRPPPGTRAPRRTIGPYPKLESRIRKFSSRELIPTDWCTRCVLAMDSEICNSLAGNWQILAHSSEGGPARWALATDSCRHFLHRNRGHYLNGIPGNGVVILTLIGPTVSPERNLLNEMREKRIPQSPPPVLRYTQSVLILYSGERTPQSNHLR